MAGEPRSTLTCGCVVATHRDFLGRGVGTIVERGASCPRADHVAGHTLLLPGREQAGGAGGQLR